MVLPCIGMAFIAIGAAPARQAEADAWQASEVEIPMRDGVFLHTLIQAPRHPGKPLPIMIVRTPYGCPPAPKTYDAAALKRLNGDGFILVNQDIRGKFKSGGQFVMLRPPHRPSDIHGVDESTDTYDTIDWLIHHVDGNNGRVGIRGVSYDGWLAAMALVHPHPALKASSPQAPVADMFLGDDFHHNGAFRLSYGFEYVWLMESGKELNDRWPIDKDAYDWYLENGPDSALDAKYLHGRYPSWNDFVAHPNYDGFWKRQAIGNYLRDPLTVPTLLVGGWYDQEDFYGPQRIYETLARHDPNHLAYLVLGPWNHGGWGDAGQTLGPLDFGSKTGDDYWEKIEKPWFDHWLKGHPFGDFRHVHTFETGSNRWVSGEVWPPATSMPRNLYLGPDHTASLARPTEKDGFDSYVSDPAKPAPYRTVAIKPTYGAGSTWYTWLTDDQRGVGARPDVLTWQTPPLDHDLTIAGDVVADLFASTTGTDSDWVVKLLDVSPAPSGYQAIVSDEVFRGRFRKSFEHPQPIVPNQIEEYRFSLHSADHTFLKGHRIGVQIQSAWFPLIDRNPQTFVPNIFQAKPEDFRSATQRIYRSRRYPTHVVLPVKEDSGIGRALDALFQCHPVLKKRTSGKGRERSELRVVKDARMRVVPRPNAVAKNLVILRRS